MIEISNRTNDGYAFIIQVVIVVCTSLKYFYVKAFCVINNKHRFNIVKTHCYV